MIQILFCGRCLPAVRNVICLSLTAAFAICVPGPSRAEDPVALVKWVAPSSQSQKVNPVAANSASIEAGRKIYMQRCAKCHGQTGHGDGPDAIELKLHPAKFTESSIHDESDGALFWKITVGRKGMPDFGKRLPPNDRWNVINFLCTLSRH